ncbi:MAG: bifunctional diaminohydroxyphosphoribosylaminopyrimidine deaminase/5-amino-6-(5-phosphoribosylamino)uracil reductase RibD, partial [Patescibacteria group bacterium]
MLEEKSYMSHAIKLAQKATNPSYNPRVGAIVIKNGKVIATGFHKKAGQPHAEVIALKKAGSKANGATLVVTLEPCNHHGKTPPCTRAILKAGISKVVIGMLDPTKAGGGVE